jgi:hypothetical protein
MLADKRRKAATCIQKYVRGYQCRQKIYHKLSIEKQKQLDEIFAAQREEWVRDAVIKISYYWWKLKPRYIAYKQRIKVRKVARTKFSPTGMKKRQTTFGAGMLKFAKKLE